ncbi:MAG: hypothetical protein ACI93R_001619 [Flavobacteriales bacterium]
MRKYCARASRGGDDHWRIESIEVQVWTDDSTVICNQSPVDESLISMRVVGFASWLWLGSVLIHHSSRHIKCESDVIQAKVRADQASKYAF